VKTQPADTSKLLSVFKRRAKIITNMQYKSLAVFCGSKSGKDPLFMQHATELGGFMGEHGLTLIYGGGSKGLMGAVADAVMNHGGNVVGIIPELLIGWEHQHTGITDLQIVADMHSRKKIMYDKCDAAIILAGGYGTLDEMFEMLTWNTLNIHNKKIILLNTAGFYDHLLGHIKQLQVNGFLYEPWDSRIAVFSDVQSLTDALVADKC
jgi:uncharacterized protein (TIGR00730 family)